MSNVFSVVALGLVILSCSAFTTSAASQTKSSANLALSSSRISALDDLGWVQITDVGLVSTKQSDDLCSALARHNVSDAEVLVSTLQTTDSISYFHAYLDYLDLIRRNRNGRDFQLELEKKSKSADTIYLLTGIKILKDLMQPNAKPQIILTNLLNEVETRQLHTKIEYVLFSNIETMTRSNGLKKARRAMLQCTSAFPKSPQIRDYAAVMYETQDALAPNLPEAIHMRKAICETFPAYERNYNHLALDLLELGQKGKAKLVLKAYFARFSAKAKYSTRNRQLLNRC